MDDLQIKPVVSIWIPLSAIARVKKGVLPPTWNTSQPSPSETSTEFINIFVPYDYFIILYDKKVELDQDTSDLPF